MNAMVISRGAGIVWGKQIKLKLIKHCSSFHLCTHIHICSALYTFIHVHLHFCCRTILTCAAVLMSEYNTWTWWLMEWRRHKLRYRYIMYACVFVCMYVRMYVCTFVWYVCIVCVYVYIPLFGQAVEQVSVISWYNSACHCQPFYADAFLQASLKYWIL